MGDNFILRSIYIGANDTPEGVYDPDHNLVSGYEDGLAIIFFSGDSNMFSLKTDIT